MQTMRIALSTLALISLWAAGSTRADKPCEDACWAEYPATDSWWDEAKWKVPRKGCLAKCWALDKAREIKGAVSSAVDTVKEHAASAVETIKEHASAAVETIKHTASAATSFVKRNFWDPAKRCLADGVGGCLKNIVTAAGNLIKGAWDAAKKCVADGLGGCLCKGVGVLWDKARQCCAEKGAWQCVKDAASAALDTACKALPSAAARSCCAKKGAVACAKEAGRALIEKVKSIPCAVCRAAERTLVGALSDAVAWLLNKAGALLKDYKISLSGSEIGALACAFGAEVGKDIAATSRSFGDPVLSIHSIKLGASTAGVSTVEGASIRKGLVVPLGAKATLSVPGQEGSFTVGISGVVDVMADTTCNFGGPLLSVGVRVTGTEISKVPQWLTNTVTDRFVNPSLGCSTFCMKPLKAAGMDINIDLCKVIDTCLEDRCAAPVLNTILDQIFPISVPLAVHLQKKAPAEVVAKLNRWSVAVGGVKFRTNPRNPYRPSITATVSLGPPKQERFKIQATGSLAIDTFCMPGKESMVKVAPWIGLKIGDVPDWMQKHAIPEVANAGIGAFLKEKSGVPGQLTVAYPAFLAKYSCGPNKTTRAPVKSETPATSELGLIDKIKAHIQTIREMAPAIVSAVKTALAGRFVGDRRACDRFGEGGGFKIGGKGGACKICLSDREALAAWKNRGKKKAAKPAKPTKPSAEGVEAAVAEPDPASLGHLTGDGIHFREGPSRATKSLRLLYRCTQFKVLEREVPGETFPWTKVDLDGKVGFIARSFVAQGPALCKRKR